jgi:hypothetical protein
MTKREQWRFHDLSYGESVIVWIFWRMAHTVDDEQSGKETKTLC